MVLIKLMGLLTATSSFQHISEQLISPRIPNPAWYITGHKATHIFITHCKVQNFTEQPVRELCLQHRADENSAEAALHAAALAPTQHCSSGGASRAGKGLSPGAQHC